jgi:hypothetical protein
LRVTAAQKEIRAQSLGVVEGVSGFNPVAMTVGSLFPRSSTSHITMNQYGRGDQQHTDMIMVAIHEHGLLICPAYSGPGTGTLNTPMDGRSGVVYSARRQLRTCCMPSSSETIFR